MFRQFEPAILLVSARCIQEATPLNLCTNEQTNCKQALRHALVCQNAELHCKNWQDNIQQYSLPLPSFIRRQSPWNTNCSAEEFYCPLTFQCLNKTEACSFATHYTGGGQNNSVTPWGLNCSLNEVYCPLYASCIPNSQPCSLNALSTYLSNNSIGYFGQTCSNDEHFCPGTQSCISSTIPCTYNESLAILNITCLQDRHYCIDERACTNQTCTSPVPHVFAFNDTETGWNEFCDNFQYICPKILSIQVNCEQIVESNPDCLSLCGPSPETNCYCPNDTFNAYCKSPTVSSSIASDFYSSTSVKQSISLYNESSAIPYYPKTSTLNVLGGNLSTDANREILTISFPVTATETAFVRNTLLSTSTEEKAALSSYSIGSKTSSHAKSLLLLTIEDSIIYMSNSLHTVVSGEVSDGGLVPNGTFTETLALSMLPSHIISSNTTTTIADPSPTLTMKDSLTTMSTSAASTMSEVASYGESLSVYTNIDTVTLLPSPSYRASSNTAATTVDSSLFSTVVKSDSKLPTKLYSDFSEVTTEVKSLLDHSGKVSATLPLSSLYETSSFSTYGIDQSSVYSVKELTSYFSTLSSQKISDSTPTVESSLDFSREESAFSLASDKFSKFTTHEHPPPTTEESMHQTSSVLLPSVPEPATSRKSMLYYTTDEPKISFSSNPPGISSVSTGHISSSLVYADSIIDSFKDTKGHVSTTSNLEVSEFALSLESSLSYHRIELQYSFSSIRYEATSQSTTLPISSSMDSIHQSVSHVATSLYPTNSEVNSVAKSSSELTQSTQSDLPSSYDAAFILSALPSRYSSKDSIVLISSSSDPKTSKSSSIAEASSHLKTKESVTSSLSHLSEMSSESITLTNPSSVEASKSIESLSEYSMRESRSSYLSFVFETSSRSPTFTPKASMEAMPESVSYLSTSPYPASSEVSSILESSSEHNSQESIASSLSRLSEMSSESITLINPSSVEASGSIESLSDYSMRESRSSYLSFVYETSSRSPTFSPKASMEAIPESVSYLSTSPYPASSEVSSILESSSEHNSQESIASSLSRLSEMSSESITLTNPSSVEASRSIESFSDYSMRESRSSYLSFVYETSSRSPTFTPKASMEAIPESVSYLSTSPYPASSEVSSILESSSEHNSQESIASSLSRLSEMSSESITLINPSSVEASRSIESFSDYSMRESRSSYLSFVYETSSRSPTFTSKASMEAMPESVSYLSTSPYPASSEVSSILESSSEHNSQESIASSLSRLSEMSSESITLINPSSVEASGSIESLSEYSMRESRSSYLSFVYETSSRSPTFSPKASMEAIQESVSYLSTSPYPTSSEVSSILESSSEHNRQESIASSLSHLSVMSSGSITLTNPSSVETTKQSSSLASASSYTTLSKSSSIKESRSHYTIKESLLSFLSPSYETFSTSNGILELSSTETKKESIIYISSTSDSTPSVSIMQRQSLSDSKSEQSMTSLLSSSNEAFSMPGPSAPSSSYASKESTSLRISNIASTAVSSKEISSSDIVRYLISTSSSISSSSSSQTGTLSRTSPVPPFETLLSPYSASLYLELSDSTIGATTSGVVNQASIVSPIPTLPSKSVCLVICQLQLSEINTKPLAGSYPTFTDSFKIAIVHFSFTSNATLKAYYNGSWHKVLNTTVGSALVLGSTEKLRVDTSAMVSGEFLVQIANVSSILATGSRINATGQRLCQLSILYIPTFDAHRLTFSSHRNGQKMVFFKDRIYVNQLFNTSLLVLNFQSNLQAPALYPNVTCVKDYLARVQYVKKCIPKISVTFGGNTNLLPVDTGNIDYTFMTMANVSFGLLYVCGNETFRNENHLLYRQIQRKNCQSNIINAPYIPYRSSSVEYFIRDITGFQAEDQGIAIVHSQNEYGSFEWRTGSNGTWQQISFITQNQNTSVKLILLKPNDKIRFTLNGTKLEWDATAALNKASIKFHKWDAADNRGSGVHYMISGTNELNCETSHLSFCCNSQFLVQIPLGGCDQKPGSTLKNNTCGECKLVENQIYRKCNDCNAVIDGCSKCTMGSTGKTFNYLKDCLGLCDKAINDSCGNCLLKSESKNFIDCNGVCNGKAFNNSCGHCVNGTTGKPNNLGMDECGVCNGNGSSCQDCSREPNGNKVKDHCGNCLPKNHPSFNNCTKFIDFPSCWAIENELEINVIGVRGYRASECSFVLNSLQYQLNTQFINDTTDASTFKISASSINPNDYYLKCNFTSGSNKIAIQTLNAIRMYSNLSTSVTSSSPLEAPANSAFDLTITGPNFPNCSNVKCITKNGLIFEATMDNASIVRCHVPKLPPGFLKVLLAFSTRRVFDEGNHVTVSLFLIAANVTSAKFQNSLNKISITLDADSYTSNSSCSAFLKNISTLGNSPKCLLTSTRQLTVYLGRGASIVPGDTLIFVLSSINRNAITKYLAQEQSVVVLSPIKPILPKVLLHTAATVGSCADIYLSGSDSYGSAGRPLKYYWNASVSPSHQLPLSNAQQSALEEIKQNLSSAINQQIVTLQANSSLVGIPIKFDLCIENFLNQKGCATKTVTRVSSNVPVVDVGHDQRSHLITKEFIINANTYFQVKCLQASKGFWYQWSCSGGIVLNPSNISTLYVPSGTFEGGQSYKIDLTVSPTSDVTASAKASITLLAVASTLNVFLNVPPHISMMEQLDFTPEDPDNPGATLLGTCFVSFQNDQSRSVTTYDGTSHRSLVLNGCNRFQIPVKNHFTSGKCYKSKLDYEYQGQTAIFEKEFCISNSEVPVTFITPPTQRDKFDVSSQLVLKALIYYSKVVTDVVWRCEAPSLCTINKNGNERNKVTKLINRNCIKGCLVVLIVSEGMLPWDTKLNFSITVSSNEGASLIRHNPASIIVSTNGLPRGGLFTVHPLEGETLVTKFQLAASNWLDREDHLPLQYRFGYIDAEKREVEIKFSLSSTAETSLPPGDERNNNKTVMFVDVIDQYGAKKREIVEVIVKPRDINEEMLKNYLSSPTDNIASEPLSSGISIRNAMLAHARSKDKGQELKKSEIDLKKHICNKLLQTVDFIKGQSGKENLLQAISGVLLLMTKSNIPNELILCAAKVSLATAGGKLSQQKRRRRAISVTAVDPISVTQAESHLGLFDNLDPSKNDPNIREASAYFLTTVATLMRGMCRSSIPLGPALVAKSRAAVLQAVTVDIASTEYSEIQLGCKDCHSYLRNVSYFYSGASLADLYSSYVCNPNHKNCTTVCLSSAQMPLDYLSNPVEPDRLSYVIYITLWNPDPAYSANELLAVGLSQPIIIKIPLTHSAHGLTYLCKRWDVSTKKWIDSDITTLSQNITTVDSTPYINCSVNQAGYIAVFKGPTIQTTTSAPSTTTTTLSTAGRPRIVVQFSFLSNCTIISGGNKAKFEESVRQGIERKLNQNNVKVLNEQAKCDNMSRVTVKIDIVGIGENETLASVNRSVMLLKTLVESGALVITLWDGKNITADPKSFEILSLSPTLSTSPTVTSTPKPIDKGLSAGAIAGIVIAVVFFIVVLACIVYYCFIRKHTKRYPLVHPTESGFEMNRVGIVNKSYDGYQGSP